MSGTILRGDLRRKVRAALAVVEHLVGEPMTTVEQRELSFPLIVDLRAQGKANRSSNP